MMLKLEVRGRSGSARLANTNQAKVSKLRCQRDTEKHASVMATTSMPSCIMTR